MSQAMKKYDVSEYRKLLEGGRTVTEASRLLGVSRAAIYSSLARNHVKIRPKEQNTQRGRLEHAVQLLVDHRVIDQAEAARLLNLSAEDFRTVNARWRVAAEHISPTNGSSGQP